MFPPQPQATPRCGKKRFLRRKYQLYQASVWMKPSWFLGIITGTMSGIYSINYSSKTESLHADHSVYQLGTCEAHLFAHPLVIISYSCYEHDVHIIFLFLICVSESTLQIWFFLFVFLDLLKRKRNGNTIQQVVGLISIVSLKDQFNVQV